jgi:hypothetical protein
MDWIHLAQERDQRRALVDAVMNFWVPLNAEQLTVGFTRRTQLYGVKFVNERRTVNLTNDVGDYWSKFAAQVRKAVGKRSMERPREISQFYDGILGFEKFDVSYIGKSLV